MNAILSEKGQITIPKAARDQLGLRAGSVLHFEVTGGRLVASKHETEDPIQKWRGRVKLPAGQGVDDYLRRSREGA